MDRQIIDQITMSLATEEKIWYERNKQAVPERANFILQKKKKKKTKHGRTRKKCNQY